MTRRLVLGPPGTGKTLHLLNQVERALAEGVEPGRIAFVSFTTAAVNEARSRAMKRFGLSQRDLPYFRTLHSLAFNSLGLSRTSIMADYSAFGADCAMRFSNRSIFDTCLSPSRYSSDDVLLSVHQLSVATGLKAEDVARRYQLRFNPERYKVFRRRLAEWKRERGAVEYSDLLSEFIVQGIRLPVDVAFVDEAQDLTPQQWTVVNQAFASARELWIAGDDDQAIYHWAGATANQLVNFSGITTVLEQSHRLPPQVKSVVDAVSSRIRRRVPKAWRSADRPGEFHPSVALSSVELVPGTWMMLARTSYALKPFCDWLEDNGFPYRLNGEPVLREQEVESYRAMVDLREGRGVAAGVVRRMLARGVWSVQRLLYRPTQLVTRADLDERVLLDEGALLADILPSRLRFMRHVAGRDDWDARVDVSTIHQAKGAEADHVILSPLLSPASAAALRSPAHADDESRVWYVGVSRARISLRVLRIPGENTFRVS